MPPDLLKLREKVDEAYAKACAMYAHAVELDNEYRRRVYQLYSAKSLGSES